MDILHPNLLGKEQLLKIFRERNFKIPRLEELSRDELIDLYVKHLLPQPRRGAASNSSSSTSVGTNSSIQSPDVEMKDLSASNTPKKSSSTARQRIVFSDQTPQAVDNVSNGMKRIKLITSSNGASSSISRSNSIQTTTASKRPLEISTSRTGSNNGGIKLNPAPTKRQKITWP
ncbi:ashwin-like [Malaya genurostris]|uniref:ashwin-like n=1 Tax=Malaya genurostris TaxID=325434 RepID=UPI0026F3C896|nr:ashwin-like [Malaya genurostris]